EPRAVRDDRVAPGYVSPRCRDPPPERRACRHVDRHRLARDDGERNPQRPCGCGARARTRSGYGQRMSAVAELTRIDAAIDAGTRRLLELQRPDGIWVG